MESRQFSDRRVRRGGIILPGEFLYPGKITFILKPIQNQSLYRQFYPLLPFFNIAATLCYYFILLQAIMIEERKNTKETFSRRF